MMTEKEATELREMVASEQVNITTLPVVDRQLQNLSYRVLYLNTCLHLKMLQPTTQFQVMIICIHHSAKCYYLPTFYLRSVCIESPHLTKFQPGVAGSHEAPFSKQKKNLILFCFHFLHLLKKISNAVALQHHQIKKHRLIPKSLTVIIIFYN